MSSVINQDKGSFQLSYSFAELNDFLIAARSIKLNGFYRITLLGVQVSTERYQSMTPIINQTRFPWVVQFYSPQMRQTVCPNSQGFIVHMNRYDTLIGTQDPATSEYFIKSDFIIGRPTEVSSVCHLQNTFQFQAAASDGSISGDYPDQLILFNQPWQNIWGGINGIITFTFEYEAI